MSETVKRVLIILSASVLFGLSWTCARASYAEGANGIFIILLTSFFRGFSLIGFCLYKKLKLIETKKDLQISIKSGLVQAISIFGILGSMVYLPAPVAIVILFTNTLMLLFFLWFKGEIDVNKWLLVSTFACLVGVACVVDVWNEDFSQNIIGYILIAIGTIATTTRLYIFGKLTQYKHPAVVGAETFLFAMMFLLILPIFKLPELPHSMTGYFYALLSGVTAALATFAMFYGIAKVGSFHFSLYNKLEPVFGAIFSALLIGEILKTSQYIGMMIVLASLVFYQIWDYRRKLKTP